MKTDHKQIFTDQVFRRFTDACGGDPAQFADLLYARYEVEGFAFADDAIYFAVLKYFQDRVVPHKIAVWQAGQALLALPAIKDQMNASSLDLVRENLWQHDMSKFCLAESVGYALHNFTSTTPDPAFERAWHHHKMHNPHHPEYWLNPQRDGAVNPMQMPWPYVVEMVADWQGASVTYGTDLGQWLPKNLPQFMFHTTSAERLMAVLAALGIPVEIDTARSVVGAIENRK